MDINKLGEATRHFLATARSYPPLSLEEELELGRRIKNGDRAARERLFNHNLTLVTGAAIELAETLGPTLGAAVDVDDMVSEGAIALWDVTLDYDPAQGYKLGALALPRIKGRIMRQMNLTGRLVRIPDRTVEAGAFLARAKRALEQTLGRSPTRAELTSYVGGQITPAQIASVEAASAINKMIELDTPIGDEDATIGSLIIEDQEGDFREEILGSSLPPKVISALRKLNDTQRKILQYRFDRGRTRTYAEIADMFRRDGISISRQGVHAAYQAAIEAIRKEALA